MGKDVIIACDFAEKNGSAGFPFRIYGQKAFY